MTLAFALMRAKLHTSESRKTEDPEAAAVIDPQVGVEVAAEVEATVHDVDLQVIPEADHVPLLMTVVESAGVTSDHYREEFKFSKNKRQLFFNDLHVTSTLTCMITLYFLYSIMHLSSSLPFFFFSFLNI